MTMSTNERLTLSVLLGFAVIFNLIGSSYLEFYPTNLLIGVAFAVGISMVIGSAFFFIVEPRPGARLALVPHGSASPAYRAAGTPAPA